jgi:hypothetical protein
LPAGIPNCLGWQGYEKKRSLQKVPMFDKADYLILFSAFLSLLLSVVLWFSGLKNEGQYVGIWVPSILVFGVYLRTIKNQK